MKCIICGKEFEPKSNGQKMCSEACRIERAKNLEKERRRTRKPAELARQLKIKREYQERYCTGSLDKKLEECRVRGITYKQYQMEKSLEESR